jgi:Domain of unknown function (DUF4157)
VKAHLPPAPRARVQRRVLRDEEQAAEPVGERRLARLVRELDAGQLRDYLRALPRCERRAARLIVIRELGPRRAGPLLAELLTERSVNNSVPGHLRERLREIVGDAVDHARLHVGEEAAAVAQGTRALAIGDHVFFAEAPDDALIAHEVAHVAQSRRGILSQAAAKAVDGGVADAAELEADLAAQAVVKPEPKPTLPAPANATGLAESEAQRAAQLQAQAERLKTAPPEKTAPATPEPAPTPVAEKTPPKPPEPAKAPAGAPAKSGYVELFAKKPSQQAAEWTQVKEDLSDKSPLPKLPVKLDGKEAQQRPPADAGGKDGTLDVPAAAPPPELKPQPPKEGPPLPKPPEVKVQSDDKAAVESAGKKVIDAIPTKDPQPPPKTGPAPVVELAGETDPVRAAGAEGDGVAESQKEAAAAKEKIVKGPGAGAVQPKALDEQLAVPPLEPEPPLPALKSVEGMEELRGFGLDAQAMQAFDEVAKPKLDAHLLQAKTQIDQATQKRDKDRADAIADAQKKTADANRDAAKKQGDEVQKARKSIVDEQKTTINKQQKAVADLKQQSGAKRSSVTGKIDARVKADQQQIAVAYQDADKKAKEEHQRAEEEAKKKKQQAKEQSKDKSWWQRAKEAVASAIKSLADAVCDILAKARDAVCKLIDVAKQAACRMIDAARDFIKSAISAFGDWLKSQVSSLLGSVFPGLAAKLNSFIDRAVNAAKRAVDVVADGLKKGVTLLADGLKKTVKAAAGFLQTAVRGAAAFATAVVTGDWRAAAKMALEGILKAIGVDPAQFWAFIAKAEASIGKIVKNPGGFVGNLISAVKNGFSLFAQNFWKHLQSGFVSWLFNTVSSTGITIPAKLDVSGVFDVVCQALGLTRDKLEQKAKKLIGDKNVERVKKVMGYVEPLVKGGLGGLWEKIQQDLAGLQDAVIAPIKSYLVETVIKKAVVTIAMMFNPAGAIAKLIMTAWDVYCWLRDNAQRIVALVKSVVDSIGEIADGKLDKAAKLVDESLGKLVPIAIDLVAKIVGLGGLGEKVKEILGALHKRIDDAIDKLLQRFVKQAGNDAGTPQKPKAIVIPKLQIKKPTPGLIKDIAAAKGTEEIAKAPGDPISIVKRLLSARPQAKMSPDGTLTLPALPESQLQAASSLKELGTAVQKASGVRTVAAKKDASGDMSILIGFSAEEPAANITVPDEGEQYGTELKQAIPDKLESAEALEKAADAASKKAPGVTEMEVETVDQESAKVGVKVVSKTKRLVHRLSCFGKRDLDYAGQLKSEGGKRHRTQHTALIARLDGQAFLKKFTSNQKRLPNETTDHAKHAEERFIEAVKQNWDQLAPAEGGESAKFKKGQKHILEATITRSPCGESSKSNCAEKLTELCGNFFKDKRDKGYDIKVVVVPLMVHGAGEGEPETSPKYREALQSLEKLAKQFGDGLIVATTTIEALKKKNLLGDLFDKELDKNGDGSPAPQIEEGLKKKLDAYTKEFKKINAIRKQFKGTGK